MIATIFPAALVMTMTALESTVRLSASACALDHLRVAFVRQHVVLHQGLAVNMAATVAMVSVLQETSTVVLVYKCEDVGVILSEGRARWMELEVLVY